MTSVVSRDICPAHHRGSTHGSPVEGLFRKGSGVTPPVDLDEVRRFLDLRTGAAWAVRREHRDRRADTAVARGLPQVRDALAGDVRRCPQVAQLGAVHRAAVLEAVSYTHLTLPTKA